MYYGFIQLTAHVIVHAHYVCSNATLVCRRCKLSMTSVAAKLVDIFHKTEPTRQMYMVSQFTKACVQPAASADLSKSEWCIIHDSWVGFHKGQPQGIPIDWPPLHRPLFRVGKHNTFMWHDVYILGSLYCMT